MIALGILFAVLSVAVKLKGYRPLTVVEYLTPAVLNFCGCSVSVSEFFLAKLAVSCFLFAFETICTIPAVQWYQIQGLFIAALSDPHNTVWKINNVVYIYHQFGPVSPEEYYADELECDKRVFWAPCIGFAVPQAHVASKTSCKRRGRRARRHIGDWTFVVRDFLPCHNILAYSCTVCTRTFTLWTLGAGVVFAGLLVLMALYVCADPSDSDPVAHQRFCSALVSSSLECAWVAGSGFHAWVVLVDTVNLVGYRLEDAERSTVPSLAFRGSGIGVIKAVAIVGCACSLSQRSSVWRVCGFAVYIAACLPLSVLVPLVAWAAASPVKVGADQPSSSYTGTLPTATVNKRRK
jgi:hypothetical protein